MNLIDPSNSELYALVLHDAPYVIGAYAVIWFALTAYLVAIIRRMAKVEREVEVLSDVVENRG